MESFPKRDEVKALSAKFLRNRLLTLLDCHVFVAKAHSGTPALTPPITQGPRGQPALGRHTMSLAALSPAEVFPPGSLGLLRNHTLPNSL